MLVRLLHSLHQPSVLIHLVHQMRLMSSVANRSLVTDEQPSFPHFTFSEEPLGLPASEGFGYFQGSPGLSFGPANRFYLQAKLGFGTASSVWLARDCIDDTHVAIKILTGYATQLNRDHKLRELEVFQRLSSVPSESSSDQCARLLAQFVHPGIDEDGEHLCLVTELFWCNVQDYQAALRGRSIPVPTVKRILRHLVLGIARLHECGIAHTDIKPDNIMIDLGRHWTSDAINNWVTENPPRTYPPERSLNKMVSAFLSQSFPPPTFEELPSCNFKLADFSTAQFVSDQTTDDITPLGLRPPEVVLGGDWNESVDIWTFGCMVFTLLTNRPLFKPMVSVEHDASELDVLLYQMILFCGEFFQEDFLRRCPRSQDYFQLDCRPKKFQSFVRKPFDKCLSDSGCTLSPVDMAGATDVMSKCLRLDPQNRATAQELLRHPWLMVAPRTLHHLPPIPRRWATEFLVLVPPQGLCSADVHKPIGRRARGDVSQPSCADTLDSTAAAAAAAIEIV
ncbi:kinase-like domain-containing protein [Gymnopilus junonius]|uniref:non-specific serine/threonine protein kinase n=1 Tax=Gymnopilus junonius TaxID=109634 RepID=A0A9P5P118_GYMJU|nr:kinase-like domain-containing protein [Gymnopilus junonius]